MLEEEVNKVLQGEEPTLNKIDPKELVIYLAQQRADNDDYQQAVMAMASTISTTLASVLIHTGNIKDVDKFSKVFVEALDTAWDDLVKEDEDDKQEEVKD